MFGSWRIRRYYDETVVTAENAEQLLEAMRRATVAEEREEFEGSMKRQKERHLELQRKARDEVDHARGQAEQAALERGYRKS